jgi:glycosyltransferase involved in cell wall biosynthesis
MPLNANLEVFRSEIRACLEASHILLLNTLLRIDSRVGWRQFLRGSNRIGTYGTACGLIAYHAVAPSDEETIDSVADCLTEIQRLDGSWESPTIAEGIGLTTATCYAILALSKASKDKYQSQMLKGEDWIASLVQEDGAVGHTKSDRKSFTICISLAIRALMQSGRERHASSIDRALRNLLQSQNPDGGFGTTRESVSTLHHTAEALISLAMGVDHLPGIRESVSRAGRYLMLNHRMGDNRHKDTVYITSSDREVMLPHTYQTDGLLLQAHLKLDLFGLPSQTREIAEWLIQYQKEGYWEHDLETSKAPSWAVMECTVALSELLTRSAGDVVLYESPIRPNMFGKERILVLATEWSSKHGGLSTFNRDLCKSFARSGQQVVCFLPATTSQEEEDASAAGVTLCTPRSSTNSDIDSLFRPPNLPSGFVPTLIVGHGRITGRHAQAQVVDNYPNALRIHFLHMDPDSIEWYKDSSNPSQAAESRLREEKSLCQGNVFVVAVGPRLAREFATHLHRTNTPVHRFDPGIGITQGNDRVPPGIRCLVLGRAEDIKVKGLDIAARAMSLLPHPTPHPFSSMPILQIRGAPREQGAKTRDELTNFLAKSIDIRVSEYTSDIDDIAADIQSASVLLMPSRSEGYGLVASEAIAAGRPVLVSNNSGFGELLLEFCPTEALHLVVNTTGDLEIDAIEWSRRLESVLRDRDSAFARSRKIRDQLNSLVTWDTSVSLLLKNCRTTG